MMKCSSKNCPIVAKFEISYDCGIGPGQELKLCKRHYESNLVFSRNIKTIAEIEK